MEITEILSKMPKAPADIEKWIYEDCATFGYILFDKAQNIAVCTRCGKSFPASKGMTHNNRMKCPKCGRAAQMKSAGRGRKNLSDQFRVLILTRKGNTVWACSWEILLDYSEFGRPSIYRFLADVYTLNAKEQHHYQQQYDWWDNTYHWSEKKSIHYTHAPGGSMGSYKIPPLETVYIYKKNLKAVFLRSDMKYLWDESILLKDAYQLIEYMAEGMSWPYVEMLWKAGFHKIVEERTDRNYTGPRRAINCRGKTLPKILRLNMGEIRRIREYDPSLKQLMVYQQLTHSERMTVPWPIVIKMEKMWHYSESVKKYTSPLKLVRYIDTHNCRSANLWLDYIESAEKIGMDITRKDVLFPKDFETAHDDATMAVEIISNKEKERKIKEHSPDISYEAGDLIIKVADTQESLTKESSILNHCVRTYGDKLADGRCYIFFIRRKDAPDTPYYTLETKPNGEFVQCRGARNCSMTPEVMEFKNEFIKYLQNMLKKKERKAA